MGMNCLIIFRAPDKKVIEDTSEIFFIPQIKSTCCDPSLEPSRRDGSSDGSQNMFQMRNMANCP